MTGAFDVVTGGAGFIGSHLCRALIRRGQPVKVVDNFSTGSRENLSRIEGDSDGLLQVFEADIRDGEVLREIFRNSRFVFHLAAMTSVEESVRDPLAVHRVNAEGTLAVLLAARDCQSRKLIFASSTAVYGDRSPLPNREDLTPAPSSPYAVSKYCGELYCHMFSNLYDLATVCLRYFNVFGPRQDPHSSYAAVIPRFSTRYLEGKPAVIFGDGHQTRDFVFVEDVVRANLQAAESAARAVSLNIASGRSVSLRELVAALNRIRKTDLEPVFAEARAGEVRHSQADLTRARQQIGYQPQVSLEEGLKRTLEWFERSSR